MPNVNVSAIKCAELFWKTDACHMEYRCVSCDQCFYTHADCFWHVQKCLLLNEARSQQPTIPVTVAQRESTIPIPRPDLQPIKEEDNSVEIEFEEADESTAQLLSILNDSSEDLEAEDSKETEEFEIEYCKDSEDFETEACTNGDDFETIIEIELKPNSKETPKEMRPLSMAPVLPQKIIGNYTNVETSAKNNITTAKPYKERKCNMETISKMELLFSRRLLLRLKQNQPSVPNILECDLCGIRHSHRHQMLKHMHRVHIKQRVESIRTKYCCEICGKQFSELGNLRVHTRIHTGEKPFPCPFESCERRFLTTSERTIHVRVHSGEKPYQCSQCPKQFHNRNHMNMHLRTVHSNERPFQCEQCGRSFKIREIYKKHLLTHSDERPYHCEVCGLSFRQRSAFQVHQNIHNDHRPFKCGHCDRGFHSSAARRSHEKLFHKIL